MIKAVIFDLDGTLLPMNEDKFVEGYLKLLSKHLAPYGYAPNDVVSAIWKGTKNMFANNGEKTNAEVFWNSFAEDFGTEKLADRPIFDDFYANVFPKTKEFCGVNNQAKAVIDFIKAKGLKLILATNPIYPLEAVAHRLEFIGISKEDFDYITHYENSHFSKGNPNYFTEILKINNLSADEVLFYGNNELQDGECSLKAGIHAVMVGDDVIKNPGSNFLHIPFNQLIPHINNAISQN